VDDVKVISLGGSIIAPDKVDAVFLSDFFRLIQTYLQDKQRKIILVCGGGGPAREYQSAFRKVRGASSHEDEDWIGIAATRLNGTLLKHIFREYCEHELVIDPTEVRSFSGQVLVAAGWKPGFSTDNDAVILAELCRADTVINLSNIEKVYTDDPRKNPDAKPLDRISWNDFKAITGDTWIPGKNVPFDPIATSRAASLGLKVIIASGRDIRNLKNILNNEPFLGTVIGPA
jgi:uridylate kinase